MKIIKKALIFIITIFGIMHSFTVFAMNLPYIEITNAKVISWRPHFFSIGTIKSEQGVRVSAPISGVIKQINFLSGQKVKKGDILAILENDDLKALIEQDKIKYYLSQQQYHRYRQLFNTHAVSHAEIDQYQSQLLENAAALKHDEALLNKTIIKAPFSGVLGIKDVNQGQYITAGQSIVLLENNSKIYVNFFVPERMIDKIKKGESIQLCLKNKNKCQWDGKIVALDPSLDISTRSLRVKAEINPPFKYLIPGMYIEVYILSDEKTQIIIPQNAIVYTPEGEFVYLYRSGKVFLSKIETGKRYGNNIMILKGLKTGDQVVIAGQQKLFNGGSVNLVRHK